MVTRIVAVGGIERRIEAQGLVLGTDACGRLDLAELPVERQTARVSHESTVGREDHDMFALEDEAASQAAGQAIEPDVDPEDPRWIRRGTPTQGDAVTPAVPESVGRRGYRIGRGQCQRVPWSLSGVVIDVDRRSA